MSKYTYDISNSRTLFLFAKVINFLLFYLLFYLVIGSSLLFAVDFSSKNYQLSVEKNILSISAEKADLKSILSDIAKIKDISIQYPASLDKKITIKIKEISLRDALERLLKDLNFSIIYSGSKKKAVISEIFIYKQSTGSSRVSTADKRIINRIKSYERRIQSLKNNLSKVDENSSRGRSFLNRIRSYEKNIERLRSQLH